MPSEIWTINLTLPYKLGSINCYLMKTGTGYILIDTGCPNRRTYLVRELAHLGCQRGNLQLIVLTHGDFDHAGNAAYLRERFNSRIAMHPSDSVMVEHGDMFCSRKNHNLLFKMISSTFFRFSRSESFKTDLYLEDGYDLSEYGIRANILHLPGHSKGSIGVITNHEELFCGDLLVNGGRPVMNSIITDSVAANTSVQKLVELDIKTVYPAHGRPFLMERFIKTKR